MAYMASFGHVWTVWPCMILCGVIWSCVAIFSLDLCGFMSHFFAVICKIRFREICTNPDHENRDKNILEAPGIDPGTSRMLSERSTI